RHAGLPVRVRAELHELRVRAAGDRRRARRGGGRAACDHAGPQHRHPRGRRGGAALPRVPRGRGAAAAGAAWFRAGAPAAGRGAHPGVRTRCARPERGGRGRHAPGDGRGAPRLGRLRPARDRGAGPVRVLPQRSAAAGAAVSRCRRGEARRHPPTSMSQGSNDMTSSNSRGNRRIHRWCLALAAGSLLAWAGAAVAQDDTMVAIETPAQPDAIPLGTGPLPGATHPESWHRQYERVFARNVTEATLTPFLPDPDKATGAAVIVAPGGGFRSLSMENEGWDVARALN